MPNELELDLHKALTKMNETQQAQLLGLLKLCPEDHRFLETDIAFVWWHACKELTEPSKVSILVALEKLLLDDPIEELKSEIVAEFKNFYIKVFNCATIDESFRNHLAQDNYIKKRQEKLTELSSVLNVPVMELLMEHWVKCITKVVKGATH